MAAWKLRSSALVPRRRRGYEILDAPEVSFDLRRRSHRDIALSHAWLGGSRAMSRALREVFHRAAPRRYSILDVGTGAGQTLDLVRREARHAQISYFAVALDLDERLARVCTSRAAGVCGSALALPFADRSQDLTVCSLLLHHFAEEDLGRVVRELHRVTRGVVILHDLRRSWVAVAGLWLASFPLAFHPVSRHDGVTSILRGFTRDELSAHIVRATGVTPRIEEKLGFRLVATWSPERV